MTCKRCGCTETTPCLREGQPCAWMLPDLCTACLTPEEAAIGNQCAGIVSSVRAELEPNRAERFLLAVAQGLAANPAPWLQDATEFARTAAERTEKLLAVVGTLDLDVSWNDLEDDAADEPSGPRLVLP